MKSLPRQPIPHIHEHRPGNPLVIPGFNRCAGLAAHRDVERWIFQQCLQTAGHCCRIVERDEESIFSVGDDAIRAAAAGRYHRHRAGHSFEDDHAQTLLIGWQGKHTRLLVQADQFLPRRRGDILHPVAYP